MAYSLFFQLASFQAHAEKADKNKPLHLVADAASYDDVRQIMIAEGRVFVTKGTLLLRAQRLEQREDPEGYQMMVATAKQGERVFFKQKREGLDEVMEGQAERIDYDGKADEVRLSGKAVLRRLRAGVVADESSGHLIVFNSTTETMRSSGQPATASAPSERVRMMLSPKADKSAAPAGAEIAAPPLRSTLQLNQLQP